MGSSPDGGVIIAAALSHLSMLLPKSEEEDS